MSPTTPFFGFERRILPYGLLTLLTGFFFLLTFIDIPIPYYTEITPLFLLIPVYYWTVYVPSLMPSIIIFILCLLIDLLSPMPIGVSIIAVCTTQWILREVRQLITGQSFYIVWIGFIIFVFIVEAIHWGLYSLSSWYLYPVIPILYSSTILILLYPLCTLVFIPIHRIVIRKPSSY